MLPTAAAHHQTVPVAKISVVTARTASVIRSPPSIHQVARTPTAAIPIAIDSWSIDRPQAATNGSSTRAGSGGNGRRTRPVNSPFSNSG